MGTCGHRGIGAVTLLPTWQSRGHGPSNDAMQLTKPAQATELRS
jgi:hypothetical protein